MPTQSKVSKRRISRVNGRSNPSDAQNGTFLNVFKALKVNLAIVKEAFAV